MDEINTVNDAPPASATKYHPPYWFLVVVSFLSMTADLGSKAWAEKKLGSSFGRPLDIISGNLDLVLARNRGGAWGLLSDTSESIRRPFFLLVSVLAIAFIVSLYRRLGPTQRSLQWGLPLVLGGALGNLVDRVRYSYVIDFIHMHVRVGGHDYHWPTYNVADIAICVGVGLMALDMMGSKKKSGDAA
jgi:lipoprotein signal peptidase